LAILPIRVLQVEVHALLSTHCSSVHLVLVLVHRVKDFVGCL